jgi:2-hydroxy-3-keto-5-methylthiopentenyl-1-phosphate phosphatase
VRAPAALVLDWDGTVTEVDTLHMVIERFGDLGVFHELEAVAGATMSLRGVIAAEMRTVTAPLDEVRDFLLREVRLRPGFAALVERHDPLIVSAGFHELIEPVLEREGVRARVVANHVVAGPSGWRAIFPDTAVCDVCGEHCKRWAVAGLAPFAFAGDGISDRCVSLAADLVLARAGLADWLRARGVPYERFDDLVQVAELLAARAPGRGSVSRG